MENDNENIRKPEKRLAAVWGLFCPACDIFIGTHEDPERLKVIAGRIQYSVEQLECHGCRSRNDVFSAKIIVK